MNRAEDALLGGWSVNFIYSYQTGQPFNIPCAISTTADFGCNALVVNNQDVYAGPHNRTQWVNPAAFATPPTATQIGQADYSPLGSVGQQARGPGFNNVDSSLFKNFTLSEAFRLQFRAEAFNIWNHTNYNNVDTTMDDGTTGQVLGAGEKRILQVALKYNF